MSLRKILFKPQKIGFTHSKNPQLTNDHFQIVGVAFLTTSELCATNLNNLNRILTKNSNKTLK